MTYATRDSEDEVTIVVDELTATKILWLIGLADFEAELELGCLFRALERVGLVADSDAAVEFDRDEVGRLEGVIDTGREPQEDTR